MTEPVIGLADAAHTLRISYNAAYALALRGELEATKKGARWVVSSASVDRLRRRADATGNSQ